MTEKKLGLTNRKLNNLVSANFAKFVEIESAGPIKRTESELRAYLLKKEWATLKDYAITAEEYNKDNTTLLSSVVFITLLIDLTRTMSLK